MRGVDTPPIVGEDIEGAEHKYKECCGPFRLETHSYHNAGSQSDNGQKDTANRP